MTPHYLTNLHSGHSYIWWLPPQEYISCTHYSCTVKRWLTPSKNTVKIWTSWKQRFDSNIWILLTVEAAFNTNGRGTSLLVPESSIGIHFTLKKCSTAKGIEILVPTHYQQLSQLYLKWFRITSEKIKGNYCNPKQSYSMGLEGNNFI